MISGIQNQVHVQALTTFEALRMQQTEDELQFENPNDVVNLHYQHVNLDEEANEAITSVEDGIFNDVDSALSVHSGLNLSRVLELLSN